MMTSLMLYFFLIMDGIVGLFIFAACALGVLLVFHWIYIAVEGESFIKRHLLLTFSCFFCMAMATLVPNTKQTAIIFGVPYLMENAKEIQLDKVPVKIVNYLNVYLDQEIDKMVKKEPQPQK